MAGQHLTLVIDEDGVGKSEFPDAGCDLRDLLFVVGAGIAGVLLQGRNRPALHLPGAAIVSDRWRFRCTLRALP
jgi:hypothetical protein